MCTTAQVDVVAVPRHASIADLADWLRDCNDLFAQFDADDLRHLLALASQRQVRARKAVCRKGEPGHELFIVLSGKLKARTTSGDGKEAILGLIETGEILGEMALIEDRERSADLIAVEDSQLLVIHRRDFVPFLEARPKACLGIMRALSQRLRRMDQLLEDARFLDLKTRLAKTLYQLAQEHGRTVAGGGIRIDFKISQEELGSLVGATRENVNKLVRAWVDEGVLETRQSTVIVRQPESLLDT